MTEGAQLENQQPAIGSFPEVDEAVQREFHALRDFLAGLEEGPSQTGQAPASHTEVVRAPQPAPDQNLHWWVVLRGANRLPIIAALRERLAVMPGCIAAQVVDLTAEHVRIGLTTTAQIDRQQIEFAILACRDVSEADIILRTALAVG